MQVRSGVQDAAGVVELAALAAVGGFCPVERVRRHRSSASPGERATWNGSMTAAVSGGTSAAAVLNPVNPSIATTSSRPATPAAARRARFGEPGFVDLFLAPLDRDQQLRRSPAERLMCQPPSHASVVRTPSHPPDQAHQPAASSE